MSSPRILVSIVLAVVLALAGCASPTAKRPKEPMPQNLHISGDFDQAPRWRFFPQTVFPPFLIQEGVSGRAKVAFEINAEGYVREARVVEATHSAFGGSALGTAGRMVFFPAKKAGKPVPAQATVEFAFEYE